MYRVELKGLKHLLLPFLPRLFLMYRVELKEISVYLLPCGSIVVPNVPCGVESTKSHLGSASACMFLMYRVELKASHYLQDICSSIEFLMYRVELKEKHMSYFFNFWFSFLMYRVELKGKTDLEMIKQSLCS